MCIRDRQGGAQRLWKRVRSPQQRQPRARQGGRAESEAEGQCGAACEGLAGASVECECVCERERGRGRSTLCVQRGLCVHCCVCLSLSHPSSASAVLLPLSLCSLSCSIPALSVRSPPPPRALLALETEGGEQELIDSAMWAVHGVSGGAGGHVSSALHVQLTKIVQ
eukprot:3142673-Rhodomonas_salina.1